MEVKRPENGDPERKASPLWIGYSISATWLVALAIYSYKNAADIVALAPNNLGDVLAGVFAPLAFLWLFVATLLQKEELQAQRAELTLNRKVLSLQAEELHNSVEQLKAQANILERQFIAQRKQKALADLQEGVHGICSIIIGKFSGEGSTISSGTKLQAGAWISGSGLTELLDNENHNFLIDEIINRIDKRNKYLSDPSRKFSQINFGKIPSLSEIASIITYIERTLKIPEIEESHELKEKFELEYPLPRLLEVLIEAREICIANHLSPP